ncbi:lipoyl domain-containing protein [Nannocystis sp. ILAH1]|uniref:lipoyl domain-containing protein n=1 Tax=Nannocystis sp. ILAH1 TaxID=2996789 RepID=UPI00226E8B65|nr:lipoyl domain-containing protein [Nannocystis sp. ILAH1]
MTQDPEDPPLLVRLPALEDDSSGRVRFVRRTGDVVAAEDPILEVELSKIVAELTAPRAGVIGRLFATDDDELQPGAPLYELWPLPPPVPAPDIPFPAFSGVQQPCDVEHLLARARALAEDRAEVSTAEMALLCVASLRALTATPALLERALAPFLAEPGLRIACGDVQADGTRWVQIDVGPDASPEQVLGALRTGTRLQDGEGAYATLQVVRIAPPAAPLVLPGPRLRPGLTIFAGPPTPQPVVVGTTVAVRPISTLTITADATVALASLLRFAPMLAEQLGVV